MNEYSLRIETLRSMMKSKGWDAVIISGTDPHSSENVAPRWHQVNWISGFSGEGDVVVTLDHAGLWTDTRYFIQAERQLEGSGVALHKTRVRGEVLIPEWLAANIVKYDDSPVVVAVDGLCQTKSSIDSIKAAFESAGVETSGEDAGLKIVNVPDMLDVFWVDRPQLPQSPIITLGEDIVGESRQDKIMWLRKFILDHNCGAILLTALDEIAWLLNVRASDIDYDPLVLSYLIVTFDEVEWFVKKGRSAKIDEETKDSFSELASDGVKILEYDDLEFALSGLSASGVQKIFVDPSTLNYNISNLLALNSESLEIVFGTSPVSLRKAIKNDVEIEGMREAHLEDGLAMERFLYWLEKTVLLDDGSVTEYSAAEMLGSLRASIPGYKGDSFKTISAYGENAALPHYVTVEKNSPTLEPRGIYLSDSGGQYLFGTTDITRTIPLGPCTDLEKEDYTLVLKGHISLARAIFPAGTAGCQIDILARDPLWKCKRNFGHGTGHGVGFYLNVHEGPQDIRQNFNRQPLLPGMITSDEPGIYREGKHGIRHESLLLCVSKGANDFAEWLGFEVLTLCHIDTSIVVKELLSEEETAWLNAYNERVYETLSPRLPAEIKIWLRDKTKAI